MAKRFVDTELWQKAWFQELSLENKLLTLYIFHNCDNAGVWNINFKMAEFIIGFPLSEQNIKIINKANYMFEEFDDNKIFVIDFIKFQYGTLSENCKPHKPIIEKLKKYGLYERVLKGYSKGIETLEEKEKEKEQEQYKEKDITQSLYGEYNNVCLTEEQYNKLLGVCASDKLLNELINSFSVNIEVGKERPYKAELPNAHYERLKAYYSYRKKNPDKFVEEQKKSSKAFDEFYKKEKAKLAARGIF